MFSIQTDTFAGFTRFLLKNEQTQECFAVLPECGAIVQELVLAQREKLYAIIDGVTTAELPGNMWYKSSLLFPFPGRIKDGLYIFADRTYQLPVNETVRNSALHGLVADKPFQVTQTHHNQNVASLSLTYDYDGHITGYPFPYSLQITYTLLWKHVFRLEVKAKNTGSMPMPMGFGWHPYFRTGTLIDQLRLILPSKKYYELDTAVVPTGKVKQMNGFTIPAFHKGGGVISALAFDHGFTGGRYAALAETKVYDPIQELTICVRQWRRDGFNYTQIFTPSHRNNIAIEPQTCMANAFNNGIGLKILAPGEEWTGTVSVSLE